MRRNLKVPCLAFVAALILGPGLTLADEPASQQKPRPKVEVVFCLDTTGSMGGLIEAAKQKIWAISNQIASGKPTPQLKVGLVAYRDRGDDYVTKVVQLTNDLDSIHGQLMQFQAAGGGDTPESVNKALFDAVKSIQWSTDKSTLRMIFLVGDAPPHMDYDEVQYPKICKMALKKNIIINTVQCGPDPETRRVWQDICHLAEGRYVQIDANGGPVAVVHTPYDAPLAAINAEMAKSTLVYGAAHEQVACQAKVQYWTGPSMAMAGSGAGFGPHLGSMYSAPAGVPPLAMCAPAMPGGGVPVPTATCAVAADRACYNASTGCVASFDLLDNVKEGKVKLETLKKEELPKEMQGMTLSQQKEHLNKLSQRRAEIMKEASELARKRNDFIVKKQAEDASQRGLDSFDNQVLRILQQQAQRNGIEYGDAEEKKGNPSDR